MDYETVSAAEFGRSLTGDRREPPVARTSGLAAFLQEVFGLTVAPVERRFRHRPA
jgi:hypothetical protein